MNPKSISYFIRSELPARFSTLQHTAAQFFCLIETGFVLSFRPRQKTSSPQTGTVDLTALFFKLMTKIAQGFSRFLSTTPNPSLRAQMQILIYLLNLTVDLTLGLCLWWRQNRSACNQEFLRILRCTIGPNLKMQVWPCRTPC